jgi:uroporphyrinogen-III synthase
VAVKVLTAPSLATAWPDLDRFEGPGYRRILVPVFETEPGPEQVGERRLRTVANLYSANEASPDS